MSKKIDILVISHSFLRKINTSVYKILKNNFNISICLVCPLSHKENKKVIFPDFNIEKLNIDLIFKKTLFNNLRFKIYLNLSKTIYKKRPSYVLLDMDLISIQSIILLIMSSILDFKVCYFSNENNIMTENRKIVKFLKIIFYRLIYFLFKKKIFKIFCYTNQIKYNLDSCGLSNKTMVVPLGFNSNYFNKNVDTKKNSKFIISYFGRLEKKKGVLTLLKALNQIKIENWFFYLDIFHIESLDFLYLIKADLKKLIKKNKIKFIKCNHNNINIFMQKTDLTILPSEWNEQYGRIIQEATACGSMVIGSKIGAIPEILIDENFLFSSGNVNSLSAKIENIYKEKDFYRKKFSKIEKNILKNRTINSQAKLIFSSLFK